MFHARLSHRFLLMFSMLLLAAPSVYAAAPQTMRLDYYHTGNATQETFSFDRVVIEPLPWPGDMSKTIDDTNLGNYFFEVRDQASRPAAVFARIRIHLQRVVRHRRSEATQSHFFRVATLSCPGGAGKGGAEGAARR